MLLTDEGIHVKFCQNQFELFGFGLIRDNFNLVELQIGSIHLFSLEFNE